MDLRLALLVVAVFAANECNPDKTCNVCAACCKAYIVDGAGCDACVQQSCPAAGNECNPVKSCNVCDACCRSYIADGPACDSCVAEECPAPSKCAHDGYWDASLGYCTNCAGAWGGPSCSVYNKSVSVTQQLKFMAAVANASQSMLDSQAALNPLCTQGSQCAGWGAVALGEGAMPALFPLVTLSYTDPTKTWNGKREPVEAIVDPDIVPTFAFFDVVLPTLDRYESYVATTFTAASPTAGSNGIFGEDFGSVYTRFFEHGTGLTVNTGLFPQATLQLPVDPTTRKYAYKLDKNAVRVLAGLPPPPAPAEDVASWWSETGPLFTQFFDNWGTAVIVSGQIGGMVELYSTYANMGIPEAQLLADSQNDFTRFTGQGGHFGAHDPQLQNIDFVCLGGDPGLCNETSIASDAWGRSTAASPVLLRYQLAPISEFLDAVDASIKDSVEQGLQMYVKQRQQRVTWSWNVHGIGGDCGASPTDGAVQLAPGASSPVSACNNGCAITLTCTRGQDGLLTVKHHGCGADEYDGQPVASGCSVVLVQGSPDPKSGMCCRF